MSDVLAAFLLVVVALTLLALTILGAGLAIALGVYVGDAAGVVVGALGFLLAVSAGATSVIVWPMLWEDWVS